MKRLSVILLGVVFGMAMYKGEAASWFRIYEMFNFQSIHMYGFMASALLIGTIGLQFMKRFVRNVHGNRIHPPAKNRTVPRYLIGGLLFGLGWALVGACPGPIFVLIGAGVWPMLIVAAFALLGTFLYGLWKDKLPH